LGQKKTKFPIGGGIKGRKELGGGKTRRKRNEGGSKVVESRLAEIHGGEARAGGSLETAQKKGEYP